MRQALSSSNAKIALGTAMILTGLTAYTNLLPIKDMPRIANVVVYEDSTTPKLIQLSELKNNSWFEAVNSIFSNSRGFTMEESRNYEESLNKLFNPSNVNIFDLV